MPKQKQHNKVKLKPSDSGGRTFIKASAGGGVRRFMFCFPPTVMPGTWASHKAVSFLSETERKELQALYI